MSLYEKLKRMARPLLTFFFRFRVIGLPESVPEGALVVCSNHISLLDPLFLAIALDRPLTFLGKKELFSVPVVRGIVKKVGMIPLSRDGGDAAKLRLAVRELREGKALAIYPQGRRIRRAPAETEFLGGVGMMQVLSGSRVLCAGIYAKKYRVFPFRKTVMAFEELTVPGPRPDQTRQELAMEVTELTRLSIVSLTEKARLETLK